MREEDTINRCAQDLCALGCVKSAENMSIAASLLANAISHGQDADTLNVMGNFITAVGSLILLIAAKLQACEPDED